MHPNLLHSPPSSPTSSQTPSPVPSTSRMRRLAQWISRSANASWLLWITLCVLVVAVVRALLLGKRAQVPSALEKRMLDQLKAREAAARRQVLAPVPTPTDSVGTGVQVDVRKLLDESTDGVIEP